DAGDAFQGAEISPYYDSLLVKVSTHAISYKEAREKMERSLQEMRIRGVKTNIPFLRNVINHQKFASGDYTTKFLENAPELYKIKASRDRETITLEYIGNATFYVIPNVEKRQKSTLRYPLIVTFPMYSKVLVLLSRDGLILNSSGAFSRNLVV